MTAGSLFSLTSSAAVIMWLLAERRIKTHTRRQTDLNNNKIPPLQHYTYGAFQITSLDESQSPAFAFPNIDLWRTRADGKQPATGVPFILNATSSLFESED